MYYMQFIVENIRDSALARAAPRLSSLVERSNSSSEEHRSIRRSLLNFFADFVRKLTASDSPHKPTAGADTADPGQRLLNVRLADGKQILISAQIVTSIMELLCESFDDNAVSLAFVWACRGL